MLRKPFSRVIALLFQFHSQYSLIFLFLVSFYFNLSVMEEDVSNTTETNSVFHDGKMLRQISMAVVMDRKRKLQAEELGVPPTTKQKWLSGDFGSKDDCFSGTDSDAEEGVQRWETGEESAKDSNSIALDDDSTVSVSNDADVDMDQCSSYWAGYSSSKSAMKSAMESSSSTMEQQQQCARDNVQLHSSQKLEEHLLEFGGHIDCSCSECKAVFENYTQKEIEEILYTNGVSPNNYVLSSGRWAVKQDASPGAKKLTIDKEFEQYFSTLML